MKTINTLVPDIYELVSKEEGWFNSDLAEGFVRELGLSLVQSFGPRDAVPRLRLSQMGDRCPKQLWGSIHSPASAEPLPPYARIKYAYGHVIEALVIAMAKAAGHEVTGEQDELVVDGVYGHRDCVIDGCVVDVKSASSRSFQKFKDGSIAQDDPFGYLDQLDGYLVGSQHDPLVTVKDRGYLLAVDKTLGHMCLYEHKLREDHIRKRIKAFTDIVMDQKPPKCGCLSVPDGKSGNLKLDVKASYNPYKYFCNPNIRTFIYSDGPRYLTKVVRLPDVLEVDLHGKKVYN